MKTFVKTFLAVVVLALVASFSSSVSAQTYWIVDGDGQLKPVEKSFFDLHDPEADEHASVETTSEDPVEEEVSEEGVDIWAAAEETISESEEEAEAFETLDEAETAIKEKILEKYKIQIDGIITRLIAKMGDLPDLEREAILENMQGKINRKKNDVISSETIDDLRKQIILEILDYIVISLEPTGSLEEEAVATE